MSVLSEHPDARWSLRGRPPLVEARVRGELDLASVPSLRRQVDGATRGAAGTVVCDLTQVTFADSQLAHWLLGLHRERRDVGGALVVLVAPGGPVERLLRVTGVDEEVVVVAGDAASRAV